MSYQKTQSEFALRRAEKAEAEVERLKGDLSVMRLKLEAKLSTEQSEEIARLKAALEEAVAMLRTIYEDDYLQSKFSKALGGDAS